MHRRKDGSIYNLSGLTESIIFRNKSYLGPEKLSLALRYLTVEAAILLLFFMHLLGGGENALTQLKVQRSTRSSLRPSD